MNKARHSQGNRVGDVQRQSELPFFARQFAANFGVAAVLTMAATMLVFHGRDVVPLWGVGNLAFDLIPSTLLPTIGASVVITRATLADVAAGLIAPSHRPRQTLFPRYDPLAGLVIGLLLLAVLGPLFIGAVSAFNDGQPVAYQRVIICKLSYALILCLANTPIIVWRAKALS